MAKKKYDLCVKVGSYEVEGKSKNRYLNIGAILEGENGTYMLLNKTFNPAGVVDERSGASIIVSMFEPKENNKENKDEGWSN